MPIPRHKAAISRTRLSRPLRLALEASLLAETTTVLDYGCGRGDDLRRLRRMGLDAVGWDPHFKPKGPQRPSQLVNLGFVLNVIEDPAERVETLRQAWALTEQVLLVTTLVTVDASGGAIPFGDGVVTTLGTFQKYFDQQELRNLIRSTLSVEPVALDMGVFAVIRDAAQRAELLARQFQHRPRSLTLETTNATFEANRARLEPLLHFLQHHGRWPADEEREPFTEAIEPFGSLGRATTLLGQVLGDADLEALGDQAREDLLLSLALSRIGEPLRFSDLSPTRQRDVRALFGRFTEAEAQANALLFSLGDEGVRREAARHAPVGKRLPDALYIHVDYIEQLPLALRIYEACARTFLGRLPNCELVKLRLDRPVVSYLSYPQFDRDPHPALTRSLNVDLQTFRAHTRDFSTRDNPPILHRKELFVGAEHPRRATFERLTRQEEGWDLYDRSTGDIGTREGWRRRLDAAGVTLRGHRVVVRSAPA